MALHCQIALPRGQSSNRILGFSILLLILECVTSEMKKGLRQKGGGEMEIMMMREINSVEDT